MNTDNLPATTSSPSSPRGLASAPTVQPPDFQRSFKRFMDDEDGQSMVEFTIVLPVFLFLVMGIIQIMLIANASYFVNYGNFMAMRSAVAHWEMSTIGQGPNNDKIPDSVVDGARNALRYSLLPIGYFKGDRIVSSRFILGADVDMNLDFTHNYVESYSTYDYPLMIPLARNIISAIMGGKQGSDDFYQDVLPYTPDGKDIFGIPLPDFLAQATIRIRSNSGVKPSGGGGGNTQGSGSNKKKGLPHKMMIHRRW